jgi:streptomycin 6-kinase
VAHEPHGAGTHDRPAELVASCRLKPQRSEWLAALAGRVAELQSRWNFRMGPVFGGASCAWVARVVLGDGTSAALKLGMPHFEGEHEIEGLRFWNGDPTVRLLAADDRLGAALLECCEPGTPLRDVPEDEQDVILTRLLRRLWRAPQPPHPFRKLSALTDYWTDETLKDVEQWPDAGLVREGLRLFRALSRNAPADVLLATDLHAGNVLRATREPWLAIDPKPFLGDPAFDATQHLFNCPSRMRRDPDGTIGRLAELLDVESERIRLWMFARLVAEPRGDWGENMWTAVARRLAP